ncbi:uncharacterized protein LOC129287487 [Prosopis cineraria]|uniref:uncharacterized protein LOC129287487 n=1 Tax=Prosopis cineraria TaxID=364024 RepID=UPI00240F06FD|nr:uncharacterized protein LOC129287487 [Prosopis cineraria]
MLSSTHGQVTNFMMSNTVSVDMEFVAERDYNGRFVLRYADADDSCGIFTEKIDQRSMFLLRYEDKFRCRIGMLKLYCAMRSEYEVQFTTGIGGDSVVTYFVHVVCNPLKGLDVDICGPYCEYDDYIRRPIGSCFVEHVQGMPPHGILKQAKVKSESNEGKQIGKNIVGPLPLASTQSSAILNAGQNHGSFNGSNFKDCNITIDTQAIGFKGFNST